MCIAYFAVGVHADWPLFIAANRDEFHQRPTLAAAPWADHPHIIAGIDLLGHGTWLGISTKGRFALLTNYRDMAERRRTTTRGQLVSDFLCGDLSADGYAAAVADKADEYSGFNLLVGDMTKTVYFSNRGAGDPQSLAPGRYVLSNHLLDTPWPKSERLRNRMAAYPSSELDHSTREVFDILKDGTVASDAELPATGLSLDRERLLSSPFIVSHDYGTRCSTVIAVHASGRSVLDEVTYNAAGLETERHSWPFQMMMPG